MLTKIDLSQIEKLVRKVVREEVENETKALKEELQADIIMTRIRVQNDIEELKNRIKNVEIRFTGLETKIIKMHKDLKNEIKMVVEFLDKDNMKTVKRAIRIESHLGLATP